MDVIELWAGFALDLTMEYPNEALDMYILPSGINLFK